MEKNIKFEDVVTFIKKAIERNLKIRFWCDNIITIGTKYEYTDDEGRGVRYNCIDFKWDISEENLKIAIDSNNIRNDVYIIEVIDKKSIYKWKILVEELLEYTYKNTETKFNNFFKEDSKPTDINDLNNEDD